MKKTSQFLILSLIAFVSLISGTAYTNASEKPNYVITTDATYPPFDFQDKNNQYTGIDQEILKTIAKREGFTYTLKPMSFNAATQSVSSDQADGVIAGMSIDRKSVV